MYFQPSPCKMLKPLQYSAMCTTKFKFKFKFKFTLLFEVMQYSTEADCNGEDFFHFVIDRYLVEKNNLYVFVRKDKLWPKTEPLML